jgi:hypothetical protein
MTDDLLEMMPARLTLADAERMWLDAEREALARYDGPEWRHRFALWRGIDGGQSVLVLQVMGQMWADWSRWGLVPQSAVPSESDGRGEDE